MAHFPKLGGADRAPFPLQFDHKRVDPMSLSTTMILQLANDGSSETIAHATGFFWLHEGCVYLITARHVITGRSPFDDQPISDQGYLPSRIVVHPTWSHAPNSWTRGRVELTIDHVNPNWIQDPQFETLRTDIAAIPIPSIPANKIVCINSDLRVLEQIFSHVGVECAIAGYPTSNFGDTMTPVWRTGTMASEPVLPIDGKPMFLIDALLGPGFSGAPVFRRHFGPLPIDQPDGNFQILADRIMTTSFVGVYAGRFENSYIGNDVPFVFYGNRIPIILATS